MVKLLEWISKKEMNFGVSLGRRLGIYLLKNLCYADILPSRIFHNP